MNTQVWLVLIDREMRKRVVALTALIFQLLSFAAFASAQARDSQTRSAPSKPKATDPTSETPSCLKFSQLNPNNNDLKRSDYARSLQAKWDAMRREAVRQGGKSADNVLFSFVAFGDESEFLTISTNPKNEKALNVWQTLFADGTNLDGEACFYGFNEVRFDLGVGKESRRVATHLESVKRMLKVATGNGQTNSPQPSNGAAPAAGAVFRAGVDGIGVPACFYTPNPPISDEARKAKYVGVVQAQAVVTVDGRVTEPKVLKSPGMGLDETVVETLRTWRCKPATGPDGHPVATLVPIEISFRTY